MGNWFKAHRPTPAMLVAVVALVIAATGVATALPGKNSVDSGDIANGQVSSKDLSKKAKAKWAHVDGSNGNIYKQSGGLSAVRVQAGVYNVNFGSSLRNYSIQVTASNPAGNQDIIMSASRCGEGPGEQQFCAPDSRVNPKWVDVHAVESDLSHRDSDFWITATPR